jgi:TolB-like protein/DNA-binding winged helix-turn-helix (wHTH) protein
LGLDNSNGSVPIVLRFADLVLDRGQRSVRRGAEAISLPRKSYDLLLALVEASPDTLSSDELISRVWQGAVVSQATVAKRVELLRQALGDDSSEPRYIALARGYGYRLIPDVQGEERAVTPRRRGLLAASLLAVVAVAAAIGWFLLQPASPPERSIAVLPFEVISDEIDAQLFADGLADELRYVLSSKNELQVTGRTSSVYFEGREEDIRSIGETLGVAHVLEGSVRYTGERIRVSAQLTSTSDGFTLWSETYDREPTSAIAIQEDIALNVGAYLKVAFGGPGLAVSPDPSVIEPDVYAQYLRAVSLSPYGKFRNLGEAQEITLEVVRAAPGFAPGWNRLAAIYGRRLFGRDDGFDLTVSEAMPLILEAVDKALAIDPQSAEAYANLGGIAWLYEQDVVKAASMIKRALLLNAGNLDLVGFAAEFAKYIGQFQQALKLEEFIIQRDPLCMECRYRLAKSYLYAGRFTDAEREFETLRSLVGGGYNWYLGLTRLFTERPQEALSFFESIPADTGSAHQLAGRAVALCDLGREVDARPLLEELVEVARDSPSTLIMRAHAHCGRKDFVFEWFEQSLPSRTRELQLEFPDPLYDAVRDDPRWEDVLRRIGRSKEQVDTIDFSLDIAKAGLVD